MGLTKYLVDDMKDVLLAGDNVLIEGHPGSGKTSNARGPLVEAIASELGIHPSEIAFHDVRGAYLDPVDIHGLPDIDREAGVTRWFPPDFFPTTGPAIICLEELPNWNKALHYALYQLTQEREVNGVKLDDNVWIMATGNLRSSGSGVTKLPSALRDRFVEFAWVPDPDDWRSWAAGYGVHYKFIAATNYLSDLITDYDGVAATEGKVSNERNVTKAALCYAKRNLDKLTNSESAADKAKLMRILSGYLGEVDAGRVIGFLRIFDKLVPIPSIIADPVNAEKPDDSEMDVLYALAAALARKANPDTIDAILTYIDRLPSPYRRVFGVDLPLLNVNGAHKTPGFTAWVLANDRR